MRVSHGPGVCLLLCGVGRVQKVGEGAELPEGWLHHSVLPPLCDGRAGLHKRGFLPRDSDKGGAREDWMPRARKGWPPVCFFGLLWYHSERDASFHRSS